MHTPRLNSTTSTLPLDLLPVHGKKAILGLHQAIHGSESRLEALVFVLEPVNRTVAVPDLVLEIVDSCGLGQFHAQHTSETTDSWCYSFLGQTEPC